MLVFSLHRMGKRVDLDGHVVADRECAAMPGVEALAIGLEAVGFTEAHKIEPMRGPALAAVRAGEHFLDEAIPRIRAFVGQKRLDPFGGRG